MSPWGIRLTVAAVLSLAGAALGRSLSTARRARATRLREAAVAVKRLKMGMLSRMLPLREALNDAGDPTLHQVSVRMTGSVSPLDAWMAARDALTARGAHLACLEAGDLEVVGALFGGLGASFADGQRVLLEETEQKLSALAEDARVKAEGQARLYTSLGLLVGLSLAVILL